MSLTFTQEHYDALIKVMNEQADPAKGYGMIDKAMANDLSLRGLVKTNAAIQTINEVAAKLTEDGANAIHSFASKPSVQEPVVNETLYNPAMTTVAADEVTTFENYPETTAPFPIAAQTELFEELAPSKSTQHTTVRSDVPMPTRSVRKSEHDYEYSKLVNLRVDSIHVPLKTSVKNGKTTDNHLAIYAAVNRYNERFATDHPTATRTAKNGEIVPEKVYSKKYIAIRVNADDPDGSGTRIYRVI